MGIQVLPDLIDYEIRDIIEMLNNFSFIQTKACCSGWTGESGVSDGGINRSWVGQPYVLMESLEDIECLSTFLPFIMSRMIFDTLSSDAQEKIDNYENKLNSVGLAYDAIQMFHFSLEYRNNKVCITIHVRETNYDSNQIERAWLFFKNVLIEYQNR